MAGFTKTRAVGAALVAIGAAHAAPASAADTVYGLTASDKLTTFAADSPGTASTPIAITGLADGEDLLSLDVRPATNQLVALGKTGRLYRIDPVTGAATRQGSADVALTGTDVDVDFNPTVDRLRIVTDADQNLRVNPNTGATTVDTNLQYAATDANLGADPKVEAIAYTRSFPASFSYPAVPTTTLFGIDTDKDVLVSQAPPNNGTLNTIGALGVDVTSVAGMDIASDPVRGDVAYALLTLTTPAAGQAGARLYRIDTTTGAATQLGATPATDPVQDIAVAPRVTTLVALTDQSPQRLVSFRQDRPGAPAAPVTVTGLVAGDTLVGIDTRPATGVLYGVGSSSRIYTIDPATGVATVVGSPFSPVLAGTRFGVGFNPAADRLRITSEADYNGRFTVTDPVTPGQAGGDTALAYVAGDANAGKDPGVTASAYTNAIAGAASTTLFDIDTTNDVVAEQTNPNGGVLATVGALGIDAGDVNGYVIAPRFNQGFAALSPAGATGSTLYAVNAAGTGATPTTAATKANGSVAAIAPIGLPDGVKATGLALLNEDRIAFGSATATSGEKGTVSLAVTRSASAGLPAASVSYATVDATAKAGSDYTATSGTLTFAPGQTLATIDVPLLDDTVYEGTEQFGVALSAPTGGAVLGTPSTALVTLLDDEVAPTPAPVVIQLPGTTYTLPGTPTTPVKRVVPKALKSKLSPTRDRKAPYKFKVTGTITPATGQTAATACKGGKVTVSFYRGARRVSTGTASLTSKCTYSKTVTVKLTKKSLGKLTIKQRFTGTTLLLPKSLKALTARAG